MRRWFLLGGLCGLVIVLVVGSVTARWQRQASEQAAKQAEMAQFEAGAKDATIVQSGVLSNTQRKHRKLYDGMFETGTPFNEMGASAKAQGHLIVGRTISTLRQVLEPQTAEAFVKKLAEKSDAIVIGRVNQKTSQLTENNKFVFTDYEVDVWDVIKSTTDLRAGTTITVTCLGGRVLLEGILVTALHDQFPPWEVNGSDILLFLRAVADAGCYQTTTSQSVFEMSGGNIRVIGDAIPGVLDNPTTFLTAVRAANAK